MSRKGGNKERKRERDTVETRKGQVQEKEHSEEAVPAGMHL